jgi:dimethylargininase
MPEFAHAILRRPGENFHQGLTTSSLGMPDFTLMLEQHAAYEATLQQLGLQTIMLPSLAGFPDGYFIEDAAVIVPEVAVITNPGAPARNGEQISIVPVLAQFRQLAYIQPPGTLEGGDVLIADKQVFIGLSERTNGDGARQLSGYLQPFGYACHTIEVRAGLHLKSSVSCAGANLLLLTNELANDPAFKSCDHIILPDGEEYAGNALLINGHILMPYGFAKTKRMLHFSGLPIIELDVSEARKMDGGLSCMSLRF